MRKMRKILATLLTITVISGTGGVSDASCQTSGSEFSLIEYLETHEIDSYSEFINVIQSVHPESEDEYRCDPESISEFSIEIDYEDRTVSVLIVNEAILNRYQIASNSASKSYYSDSGSKIFTISVSGTFSYASGYCNVISHSGNYSKPSYSTWTSTPTITSGNITTNKAYVRIYGIARSGSHTKSYSLTLTCDDTGTFTSY